MFELTDYEGIMFLFHLVTLFMSILFLIPWIIFKKHIFKISGNALFYVSFLLVFISIILRSLESGRLPLANIYEFGLLLVAVIYLLLFYTEYKFKNFSFPVIVSPVIFLLSSIIILFYKESSPLMPALKSGWLTFHVITAVISYSLISISFATAVFSLITEKINTSKELPSSDFLVYLTDRFITLSFPFLTLLIITGAVWAEYAWGRFWSWDPKETWALITWFTYLIYLHGTRMRGWKGRKIIYFSIFGFFVVMFTFFGVTLLLSGLHSYN